MVRREVTSKTTKNSDLTNSVVIGTYLWAAPEILSVSQTADNKVPVIDYFKADVYSYAIVRLLLSSPLSLSPSLYSPPSLLSLSSSRFPLSSRSAIQK